MKARISRDERFYTLPISLTERSAENLAACAEYLFRKEKEDASSLFVLAAQSSPTLCDPLDCSLPGSSVHGILQARELEWVAISFFWDLPNPGIEPKSYCIAGRFYTN